MVSISTIEPGKIRLELNANQFFDKNAKKCRKIVEKCEKQVKNCRKNDKNDGFREILSKNWFVLKFQTDFT